MSAAARDNADYDVAAFCASRIRLNTCLASGMSSNAGGPNWRVPGQEPWKAANIGMVGPKAIVPLPSERSVSEMSLSVRRLSDFVCCENKPEIKMIRSLVRP